MKKIMIVLAVFSLLSAAGCAEKEKTYRVTLIEFMSESCGDCIKMKPVMNEIVKRYSENDDVNIIIYNTEDPGAAKMAEKYHVRRIPALIFLDETGQEYFRTVTGPPVEIIDALIKAKAGE